MNVLLFRGEDPVAVSEQTIRQIKPFASQPVVAQWVERIPTGVTVVVEPYVNPFDETNILPLG